MKFNNILMATLTLIFSQLTLAGHHEEQVNPNEVIVKGWLEATVAGKKEHIAYIEKNMADDGLFSGGRYVGFGFNFDPIDTGKMIVSRTIEGSPASKVLKVDDEFIVVNGVEVNKANMGKLSFRGKPGEPVKATIKRAGKMQDIEVSRGIIKNTMTKAVLLADMKAAKADFWTAKIKVNEMISKGNVVYVWTTVNDIDAEVDLPFEMYSITRFEFNKKGLVIASSGLSEDRFSLEQTGFTISR